MALLMVIPKHKLEEHAKRQDIDKERLAKVDLLEEKISSIQEENTIQCYCILACLKGLAEQGCNGPVHDGIDRMEKYLNKEAHK